MEEINEMFKAREAFARNLKCRYRRGHQTAAVKDDFEEYRKKTAAKIEAHYAFLESGSGSHPTFTLFIIKADNRSAGHSRTSAEEHSDTRQPPEKMPIMIKEEYEQVNARIRHPNVPKISTSCWITPSALTRNKCFADKGGLVAENSTKLARSMASAC
jgi:hypothetical protein